MKQEENFLNLVLLTVKEAISQTQKRTHRRHKCTITEIYRAASTRRACVFMKYVPVH